MFSSGLCSLGRRDWPLCGDCGTLSAGLYGEKLRHMLSRFSTLLVGDELGLEVGIQAEVRVLGQGRWGFSCEEKSGVTLRAQAVMLHVHL